ncbi:MAG: hypothetical protein E6J13_00195 [Chloroflexi bacterium]|nr:MAG: hypothetical protein E6J13_00195 [Chloroflexota bacterium]
MLRPLGVGDVLDRTFNVYKSKPLLFIALSAIWYLLLVLAFIFLAVAVFAGNLTTFLREATTNPSPQLVGDVIAGVVVFVIIAVFLAILMLAAQSAALVYAGGRRYLAKDVTIGESFRAGLSAAGRLFVAGVLVFLAIVALWAVVFAVGAIIAVASRGSAVAVLVIGLATIVAIVGTFYLAASWLIAPVIVVVEKMGPLAALGRSWRLSDGNRWRIIGIQALLGVLNAVLSILIAGIFGAFAATSNEPGQFGAANVVENIVNFASTIIWAPVEWIAFTVLYYDLRVRKEAFDLQLAAEALPQS